MRQSRDDPDRRILPSIDVYLSFVLKNIGQLREYWRTKLNRHLMRVWADIDPIDIPKPLPYVALIEVCWNPRRFLWRLIETHITAALGYDSTGFHFDERYSGQVLAKLIAVHERVIERKAPSRHPGKPTFSHQI